MKLLIVSDMPHYATSEGQIVGWGPTVKEIDHLADLFDEIYHIGFLYPGFPPETMMPYRSGKVTFVPLQPTGGTRFLDKLGIMLKAPSYFAVIFKYLYKADVLHVRCPSSIGLLMMVLLPFLPVPKFRWFKYAGNWKPDGPDPLAYAVQRFWLSLGLHRGTVTVNGRWKRQPRHVYSFPNPSLHLIDLELGRQVAAGKTLHSPLQLLFVGRVETAKGSGRLLEIVSLLLKRGIEFELNMIGDGPERPDFEQMAKDMGLSERVHFHGWMSHPNLSQFYARAHFLILPTSASEGWPKVLSEGMAFGVVPLAGAVSSIPQILENLKTGMALDSEDVAGFAESIQNYLQQPERWKFESQAGVNAASQFTFQSYLAHVCRMFQDKWNVIIPACENPHG